ncbi:anhydro-N-acetylmuramic acid kinase [Alphaproteobacteria bacterium]|nr:anhydro-N-acetylmuramic acid kinase [Alphaproteobacteria bacterium]
MSNKKIYKVIGIMSGTSMDGLDCSLIETDGINYYKIMREYSFNYNLNYKNKLIEIIQKLPNSKNKRINYAKNNEVLITNKIFKIINEFIKKIKYKKKNIDLIGLSGQTIFHDPKNKYSLQLSSGKDLSKKINIPVVSNFRDKDILSGGQGAPIGCFYHKYLIKKININSAILNIGGVSNITFLLNRKLIGFDIGPGNAIIDDLVYFFYKKNFDKSGKYAKKGLLIKNIYNSYKKNSFFKKKYPKSLDRNYFKKYLDKLKMFKKNDAIHTASLMTVFAIINSISFHKIEINEIILTGGGRKNIFILEKLNEYFKEKKIKVSLIDKYGFNGDLIESQMFAYLAVRSIKKLPISIPSTTGVNNPISGGILYK